jgi:hypothetical protein
VDSAVVGGSSRTSNEDQTLRKLEQERWLLQHQHPPPYVTLVLGNRNSGKSLFIQAMMQQVKYRGGACYIDCRCADISSPSTFTRCLLQMALPTLLSNSDVVDTLKQTFNSPTPEGIVRAIIGYVPYEVMTEAAEEEAAMLARLQPVWRSWRWGATRPGAAAAAAAAGGEVGWSFDPDSAGSAFVEAVLRSRQDNLTLGDAFRVLE